MAHLTASGLRIAGAVFAIEGMYCGACAGVIESALKAVPGVASA